jgi:hypothetical protein
MEAPGMKFAANTDKASVQRWLRILGLIVGLGFIAWLLWQTFSDRTNPKITLDWTGCAAAVLVGVLANVVVAKAFSALVAKFSSDIPEKSRLTAFYYSQIAKYIPGRVAALLVQRAALAGPRATGATIVSNIELTGITFGLCTGAAIGLLLLPTHLGLAFLVLLAWVSSGASLMRRDWLPLVGKLASAVGQPIPSRTVCFERVSWSVAFLLSSGLLLLPALSSYVLLVFGLHISTGPAMQLTALLLLSWAAGILTFVFPAGIGIREVIFFALGGALLHPAAMQPLAGIALASRLVQVFSDLAGVAAFIGYRHLRFGSGNPP